jgi:hypothetical protein
MKTLQTIDTDALADVVGGSRFRVPVNTAGRIILLTPGSEGGSRVPVNTAGKIIALTPGSEGGKLAGSK